MGAILGIHGESKFLAFVLVLCSPDLSLALFKKGLRMAYQYNFAIYMYQLAMTWLNAFREKCFILKWLVT